MIEHNFKDYPELTNNQLREMPFSSPHKQITEDFIAKVVKVHDGDTITLNTDFRDFNFPLRVLGIDAPEMNAGGETARDWLKSRILDETVKVIIDQYQRVGKYGRLLGRVLHRGIDLGEAQLQLGLVKTFDNRHEGKIINPIKPIEWR